MREVWKVQGDAHYTVGSVIVRVNKGVKEYFLIDRVNKPLGWACVGGHVNKGDDSITTLRKETKEESGFDIVSSKKLISDEELELGVCVGEFSKHIWDVYEVEVSGELMVDSSEAKDSGWFTVEKIKTLTLESVWKYFFEKLGIL